MAIRASRGLCLAAALLLTGACTAETDRALYGAGDGGSTTFNNGHSEAVVVDCTVLLDRAENGEWIEEETQELLGCGFFVFPPGPILPLVPLSLDAHTQNEPLDGFLPITLAEARKVDAGGSLTSGFRSPEAPGEWRLRYRIGARCEDDETPSLDDCEVRHVVETNAFGVEEFCPVEECEEEAPVCAGPLDGVILPGTRGPVSVQSFNFHREVSQVFDVPGIDGFASITLETPGTVSFRGVPRQPITRLPIILPDPPVAECRRDLDTGDCRWVCDDARPIPPDTGY